MKTEHELVRDCAETLALRAYGCWLFGTLQARSEAMQRWPSDPFIPALILCAVLGARQDAKNLWELLRPLSAGLNAVARPALLSLEGSP